MGIYKSDTIVKGCTRKDGKLMCYAYDLSTLPPGAENPEEAQRKCEIHFDGGQPTFIITGKNAEQLCTDVLKDLGILIKKSKEIGLSATAPEKIIKNISLEGESKQE